MDICMYVCSKTGGTSTVLGRKKEREQRHSHPCQSHQVTSPDDAPGKYAAPQPRGKGVYFHSCSPTHTQNIIAAQGCGQESYTPLGMGDSTAAYLTANTQT